MILNKNRIFKIDYSLSGLFIGVERVISRRLRRLPQRIKNQRLSAISAGNRIIGNRIITPLPTEKHPPQNLHAVISDELPYQLPVQ